MTDSELIEKFGWQSRAEVGGFINLHEAPGEFQKAFAYAVFEGASAWPEGYTEIPTEKEALKAFAKAAKAKAKTITVASIPFGMSSYKEGGQALRNQGLVQYHTSISVKGLDYGVHWWGCNDPEFGYRQEDGTISWRFPKVKIDTQEQLNGIIES
jgi:hypothetical protein